LHRSSGADGIVVDNEHALGDAITAIVGGSECVRSARA
jgi:hypothetical protein